MSDSAKRKTGSTGRDMSEATNAQTQRVGNSVDPPNLSAHGSSDKVRRRVSTEMKTTIPRKKRCKSSSSAATWCIDNKSDVVSSVTLDWGAKRTLYPKVSVLNPTAHTMMGEFTDTKATGTKKTDVAASDECEIVREPMRNASGSGGCCNNKPMLLCRKATVTTSVLLKGETPAMPECVPDEKERNKVPDHTERCSIDSALPKSMDLSACSKKTKIAGNKSVPIAKTISTSSFGRAIHLTAEQASAMPFPPGCRVLVLSNYDGDQTLDPFNIRAAIVKSASISPMSGSWLNQYDLELFPCAEQGERYLEGVSETRLLFAPGCTVQVSNCHFNSLDECETDAGVDGVVVGWSHLPHSKANKKLQPLYSVELVKREKCKNSRSIEHCISYRHIRFQPPPCMKATWHVNDTAPLSGEKSEGKLKPACHPKTEKCFTPRLGTPNIGDSTDGTFGEAPIGRSCSIAYVRKQPLQQDVSSQQHQYKSPGCNRDLDIKKMASQVSTKGEAENNKSDSIQGRGSRSFYFNSHVNGNCKSSAAFQKGRGKFTAEVLVSPNADPVYIMNCIIGPGGRANKDLEQRTRCKVHVRGGNLFLSRHERFNSGPFCVTITGPNGSCVAGAKAEVEHLIRSAITKIVYAPVDVNPDVIRDSLFKPRGCMSFADEVKLLAKGVVQLRGLGARCNDAQFNNGPLRVVLFGADEVALEHASRAVYDNFARVRYDRQHKLAGERK